MSRNKFWGGMMKRYAGVIGLVLVILLTGSALAAVPEAISYQGYLTDVSGNPVNGTVDLTFAIYDDAAPGPDALWSELHTAVPVVNGIYSVRLGSITLFSTNPALFESTMRFLGVQVGSDPEMTPRQPLSSVAFSIRSGKADDSAMLGGSLPSEFAASSHTHAGGDITSAVANATNAVNATTAANADTVDSMHASDFAPVSHGHAFSAITGTLGSTQLSGSYNNALTFGNASNSFTGNGSGLTNLSASALTTGTVANGRLASSYSQAVSFSNISSATIANATISSATITGGTIAGTHTGNGAGLTNIGASSLTLPLVLSGTGNSIVSVTNNTTLAKQSALYAEATGTALEAYGVYGKTTAGQGTGVVGEATTTDGIAYGVVGTTPSVQGTAVKGEATSTTGASTGGRFSSGSSSGVGVRGIAGNASGTTYGGIFTSNSTSGTGAKGEAKATTGATYGGNFTSASTSGTGVKGEATATTGAASGGLFTTASSSGFGVFSTAGSLTGTTYGGWFLSESNLGYGIYSKGNIGGSFESAGAQGYGLKSKTTGDEGIAGYFESNGLVAKTIHAKNNGTSIDNIAGYFEALGTGDRNTGVYGKVTGPAGKGVIGEASSTTAYWDGGSWNYPTAVAGYATGASNTNYGGYFTTASSGGYAVYAKNTGNSNYGYLGGVTVGAYGNSSTGYGVYGSSTSGYAGYFNGNVAYTGTLTDVSDERLKENIRPVEDALAKIESINGVYFTMKDKPGQTEVGVIAQDVQQVLPEAVSVIDKENGYLGVSYTSLIPVLVEAVKELKAENDALKALVCADHPDAEICR